MIEVKALRNLLQNGKVIVKGAVVELEEEVAKILHREGAVESTDGSMPAVTAPQDAPVVTHPAAASTPDADGVQDDTRGNAAPSDVEPGGSEDTDAKPAGNANADADGVEAGGSEN